MPIGICDATAVWHEDKLYIGGGWTPGGLRCNARLYIYTPTNDTWDAPIDTPVFGFFLTTFHSQLVLIGGRIFITENFEGEHTNKLWTLGEDGEWQETLPPMSIKRRNTCAVSYGDHLLVAGGWTLHGSSNVVEVFNNINDHWTFAQPLPMSYYDLKCAILDQHWYLVGGKSGSLADNVQEKAVHYASLESLITSSETSSSVWKRLTDVPKTYSSPAVFGSRLIAIGGSGVSSCSSVIHAYSSHTKSWIHVGYMRFATSSTCSAVLPTGELMVVGGFESIGFTSMRNVSKISIRGNKHQGFIQDFSLGGGVKYEPIL